MHNTKYLQTNKKKIVNQKLKVGLVHGVFDIMHIGHIEYFKVAKKLCDKLIVSVTTDKFVNKGSNRPAFAALYMGHGRHRAGVVRRDPRNVAGLPKLG